MTTAVDITLLNLPNGEVNTEESVLDKYGYDEWTQEETSRTLPRAVVFAESIADVQAVLRFASEHQIAVVTQGSRTSIVNGSSALSDSIILSLARMNHIIDIQIENQLAIVEPGVLNGTLDEAARKFDYFYAPDPGSKPISTIGGNVATNAGGMSSLKYGTTKQAVLALKVVLASGELIEVGAPVLKNTAAYNLLDLFVGSEGTLGVIVEITVRLLPIPYGASVTGLATFNSMQALTSAVQRIQASGLYPSMLEALNRVSIVALDQYENLDLGARGSQALLIFQLDVAVDGALEVAKQELQAAGAVKVDVTADVERTKEIIKIRQDVFKAGAQYGRLIVEDIAVPLGSLATVVARAEEIAEKYQQRLLLLGHAGDGNLHPDFILESTEGPIPAELDAAIAELLTYVISVGGTVSAEHGIGSLKKKWVDQQLSPAVVQLQKQIKQVFDPQGILNPERKV